MFLKSSLESLIASSMICMRSALGTSSKTLLGFHESMNEVGSLGDFLAGGLPG
jgi:hypothetical protein